MGIVLLLLGCTPKIYVIDRQTVLFEEAAGEWPEFEKSLLPKIKNRDPVRFSKNPSIGIVNNDRKFLVLNGEIGVEK